MCSPAHLISLWRSVRGPFRYPPGGGHAHEWERFDCDKAGCLRCGADHVCRNNHVDCASCPIQEMPNGTRCCTITGLIVAEVNVSKAEFCPALPGPAAAGASQHRYDYQDILGIVEWLLMSKNYASSRERELERLLAKCKACMIRVLKRLKQERPTERPNLIHVISLMLAEEKCTRAFAHVHHITRLPGMCKRAAAAVVAVFQELHKQSPHKTCYTKFRNLVIGILYMMSTGLVVQGREIMPCWPELRVVLPQENHLSKYWDISSKVICETENEVKLILRGQFAQHRKKCREKK